MAKKIAITGAGGYIGRLLVEKLSGRDDVERIVALDVAGLTGLPSGVETAVCDVRDPDIARRLRGCDTVVHLAFIVAAIHDMAKTYDINVRGTRNVLAACEECGIEKLVVASSVAAYGRQPRDNKKITEDTPLLGDNSSYYLHTKRIMEEDLDVFEKRNPGVILTRLRPSILLGPKNNNFAQQLMTMPMVPVPKEGMALPVVHEDDVIEAFVLAVERDVPGAFIISLPEPMHMEDIAAMAGKRTFTVSFATMMSLSRILYALRLTKLSTDWVVAGEGNWRFDTSRAREVLGWEPTHDLETTMREMIAHAKGGKLWRRAAKNA